MATFLQLTLNGLAVGCIYGLVALGFVLIYKATELVNFAQGDLLMLGAFVAYMAIVLWGLDYWVGFLIAVAVIAIFGAVLDMTVLRRVLGQPQFAVVMLTIGLGAMFRTFASVTWGSEIYTLPTPFSGVTNIAGVTLSHQYLSIIAGTLILCGTLYAFFTYTRIGIAMQATSQNQLAAYYMGIPVKAIFSLVWAISAGDGGRHLAGAGNAHRHQHGVSRGAQGVRCGRAGRIWLNPRCAGRRHHHRPDRALRRSDTAGWLQRHGTVHCIVDNARGAATGPVRNAWT
jgi:branched-subunit amino acid ABC-type transport system permease component